MDAVNKLYIFFVVLFVVKEFKHEFIASSQKGTYVPSQCIISTAMQRVNYDNKCLAFQ